jgi:hypothetical protein
MPIKMCVKWMCKMSIQVHNSLKQGDALLALSFNIVLEHIMKKVMKTERNWNQMEKHIWTAHLVPPPPQVKVFKRNREAMWTDTIASKDG